MLLFLVAAFVNPVLVQGQQYQLGSDLKLPDTYMVRGSIVIDDNYYVLRVAGANKKNIDPAGKNAGGFQVWKNNADLDYEGGRNFIDVYDVNTLSLKKSFAINTNPIGMHDEIGIFLTKKGIVLLLCTQKPKTLFEKYFFSLTLRTMTYDGMLSSDSVLVEKIPSDFSDKYSDYDFQINIQNGDFYEFKYPRRKTLRKPAFVPMVFQKLNAFARTAEPEFTGAVHPDGSEPVISILDGKPVLFYSIDGKDSSTILPIKAGMDFRINGVHLPNYGNRMTTEPDIQNGNSRYLMNLYLNKKNKTIDFIFHKLAWEGEKLTSKIIANAQLDRKGPEMYYFLGISDVAGLVPFIASYIETPEGPIFLAGIRAKDYNPNSVEKLYGTGIILQPTADVNSPKVIFHTLLSSVRTNESYQLGLGTNLTTYEGKLSGSTAVPYGDWTYEWRTSYYMGDDAREALEFGEPTQTFDMRKLSDGNIQLLRPLSLDANLSEVKFVGKKIGYASKPVSTLLTIDQQGNVVQNASVKFTFPNKLNMNIMRYSLATLPDGKRIGLLQNKKFANLVKF